MAAGEKKEESLNGSRYTNSIPFYYVIYQGPPCAMIFLGRRLISISHKPFSGKVKAPIMFHVNNITTDFINYCEN